ncbi:hypothetical protein SCP_0109350 [Sparassis crispa]|uniref:F-box domain-containing protein n=1 Tax=Sparassis crispa TaxID=139825 RepID=A0A401G7C5_9APHY|nr:hypothetical protein SCP_0109350 [Sparassis crispa]GBE78053.1 hypothetical protein SCP_0109350 [Sparassis crispa]
MPKLDLNLLDDLTSITMSATSLNHDLVDRVLTDLSDFTSLSAAIRTCKLWYNAFQARQRSIVHAILVNAIGPAWPTALKLDHNGKSFSKAQLMASDMVIARDSADVAVSQAQTVLRLENLFSRRCKDRSSSYSILTPAESLRFQVALYRFWQYCQEVQDYVRCGEYSDDDGGVDIVPETSIEYLRQFTKNDLYDIARMVRFLSETVQWTSFVYPTWPESALLQEPHDILAAFEGRMSHRSFDCSLFRENFFSEAYNCVLDSRGVGKHRRNVEAAAAILDTVVGADDQCYRCHNIVGLGLWGPSNWHLLKPHIPWSQCNRQYEDSMLDECARQIDSADLMAELFALQVHDSQVWEADQWYCRDCLLIFWRKRLRSWWYARKQRRRAVGNAE